jgi:hypothetical protein
MHEGDSLRNPSRRLPETPNYFNLVNAVPDVSVGRNLCVNLGHVYAAFAVTKDVDVEEIEEFEEGGGDRDPLDRVRKRDSTRIGIRTRII